MNPSLRPRCQVCTRTLRDNEAGRLCCCSCEDAISSTLTALSRLFRRVTDLGTAALLPGVNARQERSAAQVTPAFPLRLDVISLTTTGGVATHLQHWVVDWYLELKFPPPVWSGSPAAQLNSAVYLLNRNLPWAVANRHDLLDLSRTASRYRQDFEVILEPQDRPHGRLAIGACPGSGPDQPCGRRLYAGGSDYKIRCSSCGSEWSRPEWPSLARVIADPPPPPPSL